MTIKSEHDSDHAAAPRQLGTPGITPVATLQPLTLHDLHRGMNALLLTTPVYVRVGGRLYPVRAMATEQDEPGRTIVVQEVDET